MFANKAFVRFLQKAKADKKDIVCINVLDTEGSAYRKSGATMLVDEDGRFIGVVSGGCFEEDIVHCAKDLLAKHEGKFVVHDLRMKDDSAQSWGHGVGCNGLIKLWMEPFYAGDDYGALGIALEYATHRVPQTLVRSIQKDAIFSFTSNPLEKELVFDESAQSFSQKIESPYRLLILGAGPGSEALIKIADTLGWHTTLCDNRAATLAYVPSADETLLLPSLSDVKNLLAKPFDAAVVMSHNFSSDAVYLESLLDSDVGYIGIMGPRKRTQIIIDSFSSAGEKRILDPRLHNPIGLDLGGESPESIALSICAEIEADRHRRVPAPLRDKNGAAIHADDPSA